MAKQIFVNLPVKDLAKSTAFYKALGFTQNMDFSNESASSMVWSDDIYVMLINHDFYKTFLKNKEIADPSKTSGVLLALSLDSKEAVQQFADAAKVNGGDYYQADMQTPADMMFAYEVTDPDGHGWEPLWMSPDFDPHAAA